MQKVVSFGEVMMRFSPPGKQRFNQATRLDILFSGAEANVSAALGNWGMLGCHVTRFPDNELGKAAVSWLQHKGIDTRYILFGGERLGLYFVENGAMMRPTTILYDRLPSAFSTVAKGMFNWDEILENVDWFHWTGITPALSQGAADSLDEALNICQKKNIPVSADINYRSGLWRYGKTPGEIMESLLARSQVVVASENDTRNIFGISSGPGQEDNFVSVSRQMMERFPSINTMITSNREQISASHNRLSGSVFSGDSLLHTSNYDLEQIVERIGSGDAFIAGFIYSRLNGWNNQKALDFATASAALKHSMEGDMLLCTTVEIQQLLDGNTGGRIKR